MDKLDKDLAELEKHQTGITVRITNPSICTALRQHTRDCKNTVTNEYQSIDKTVEDILYYFVIGSSKELKQRPLNWGLFQNTGSNIGSKIRSAADEMEGE